jgi:hypothetical protein
MPTAAAAAAEATATAEEAAAEEAADKAVVVVALQGSLGGRGGGGDGSGGGCLCIASAGERAPSGARVAAALLASNGELGATRRYLTQWHGQQGGDATWEAASELPTALLEDFEQQLLHNVSEYAALEPSAPRLGDPGTTGVMPCEAVAQADASACASYLRAHWSADGVLPLPNGSKCYGYASYGKTLNRHNPGLQAKTTLLLTQALLPAVRAHVAGFGAMEVALAMWLRARFGRCVTLHYAHALRQAPTTLSATGFDVHQDTEEHSEIEFTVVVKLSEDVDGEAPSRMRVVGAAEPFTYGARAGAAGCFLARMYHASMPPESKLEHLKMAFFFRVSERSERSEQRAIRRVTPLAPLAPLAPPAAPNEASEADRSLAPTTVLLAAPPPAAPPTSLSNSSRTVLRTTSIAESSCRSKRAVRNTRGTCRSNSMDELWVLPEDGEKQLRAAVHFESKLTEEGGAPLVPDADRAANASSAPEAAVNAGLTAPEPPPPLKVNSENRCLICNSADDEEVGSDPPHLSCSLIHPHSLTSHACQMSRCL